MHQLVVMRLTTMQVDLRTPVRVSVGTQSRQTQLRAAWSSFRRGPHSEEVTCMDAPNPATLRPQVRAAWRALLPLEVSLLLTGQGSSARTCTIRLHDAVQQRLPQCTMSSLSTFLTPAAVCAQVNCRLNVM